MQWAASIAATYKPDLPALKTGAFVLRIKNLKYRQYKVHGLFFISPNLLQSDSKKARHVLTPTKRET